MVKVVLDAFGGDNSPLAPIEGALEAIKLQEDLHVVLVGDETKINEILKDKKYNTSQISIIDAKDVITNDESPTVAIRQKPDSSIVKAFNYLKENDDAVALVSAGSTGAVLSGAFMKLGRIKGVSRPALCPILPTAKGGIVAICDTGANVECDSKNLVHFAIMANAYIKNNYGIMSPRVALLNVGTEDHKGDSLRKETFEMLKSLPNINFVGNMEARELLSGDVDIVVCDGFSGNVLLKSTEGAILNLLGMLKSDIKSRFSSKIGYLFMKKTFKALKKTLDYNNYGGAVFLGCKKLIVKGHGSSKTKSFTECILQAFNMNKAQVVPNLEREIIEFNSNLNNEE